MENIIEHEYSGTALFLNTDDFEIEIEVVEITGDIAVIKTSINGVTSDKCKVKEGATIDIISSTGKMEVSITNIKYGETTFEIPQGIIFAPKEITMLDGDVLNLSNKK